MLRSQAELFARAAELQQRERERKAEVARARRTSHLGLLRKHGLLHEHPDFAEPVQAGGLSPDQAWKKHVERLARARRATLESP